MLLYVLFFTLSDCFVRSHCWWVSLAALVYGFLFGLSARCVSLCLLFVRCVVLFLFWSVVVVVAFSVSVFFWCFSIVGLFVCLIFLACFAGLVVIDGFTVNAC